MIDIIIVDDHDLIREGFARLIEKQEDMRFVAGAGSAEELFLLLSTVHADIVVLDVSLPDKNGIDVLKDIRVQKPDVKVLILSMHPEEHYALRALQNGAAGYITKGTASKALFAAIKKVYAGGRYISETLGERLAFKYDTSETRVPHEKLSDREFQILCMIGEGRTSGQIADSLSISENTVRTYRRRVLEKLQLKTTTDLLQYTIHYKLLD